MRRRRYRGPYKYKNYDLRSAGCVYYPTDANPPFAAVAVSDGFLGSGGCSGAQTGDWGPLYASHGIVAMIVHTSGMDQPNTRGQKLTKGIAAFKEENTRSESPLFGKLSGRYGTSGFSMGGGGTTYAASGDSSLKSSVAIMPYGPTGSGMKVPTMIICGSSDTIAPCDSHGTPLYSQIPGSTPKIRVTINSSHSGYAASGGNMEGAWGLAFQKVYLEGDTRWKQVLLSGDATESNLQ